MITRINTSTSLRKIVSVLLVFCIFFNVTFPIFADEIPELTPTATPTIEPTPTPEQITIETSATDSATLIIGPEGTSYETNTGNNVEITTSETNTLETTIENTNNADIDKTVDATNNTGENILTDNIALNGGTNSITTGDAETIQNISTVVNTNVVAQSAAVVIKDVFEDSNEDINLSTIAPCFAPGTVITPDAFNIENTGNNVKLVDTQTNNSELVIRNTNNADIQNDITLTSNTGNNSAINNISSGTSVNTGDAYSALNLFTMANTNLVGNCYFYGVINLFGSQHGDIILPYELDVLHNSFTPLMFGSNVTNTGDNTEVNNATTTQNETIIKNTNNASVNESVTSTNTTGDNSMIDTINFNTIGSIVTGDAHSNHNVIDIINSNFVANNFFILLINRYGTWNGQVIGLDSSYMLVPQAGSPTAPNLYSTLITNTGDSLQSSANQSNNSTVVVENTNNLTLDNNINLLSNTGGNEAGRFNASINTGDAQTKANIVTMGNTNITGDNWFFAVINIFDDFIGNIIFPRPELAVSKMVDQSSHNAGDNFTYTIAYGNFGNTFTDNVKIVDSLPAQLTLLGTSAGATVVGNTVTWNVGRLEPGQTGAVSVMVKTDSSLEQSDLANTASISSSRSEVNYSNNNSTAMVRINKRSESNSGSANNSTTSTSTTNTTTTTRAVSPLGGTLLPTAATTTHGTYSGYGAVKGVQKTVAKAKTESKPKLTVCDEKCQNNKAKSNYPTITIVGLLLLGFIIARRNYFIA